MRLECTIINTNVGDTVHCIETGVSFEVVDTHSNYLFRPDFFYLSKNKCEVLYPFHMCNFEIELIAELEEVQDGV